MKPRRPDTRKLPLKNTDTKSFTLLRGALAILCLLATLSVYASDFSATDLQGKAHSLLSHRGQWVLVNLWGTWCSPCLSEIPELNKLQAAHQNLVVIGVAMQSGTATEVTEFSTAHLISYPIVMGSREIMEQIRLAADDPDAIEVMPTSYLFNPQGERVYQKSGEINHGVIAKIIKRK